MRKFIIALIVLFGLFSPQFASAAWIKGTVAELQKSVDGRTVAVVVMEDEKGVQDKFSLIDDISNIRARILFELARRNASDAVAGTLIVGTVVTVPSPPPPPTPPVPPTTEQVARTKFFTDWGLLVSLKPFADAGVVSAQSAYADALALVKSEFLVVYVAAP